MKSLHSHLSPLAAAGLLILPTIGFSQTFMINEGGPDIAFEVDCSSLSCRPAEGLPHPINVNDFKTFAKIKAEANRLETNSDAIFNLRVYEKNKPKSAKTARSLRRKILVEFAPDTDIEALALAAGATVFEQPHYTDKHVILTFANQGESLSKLAAVRQLAGVVTANPLLAKKKHAKLIPNDPRFSHSSGNTNYQWHLRNTGQNGGLTGNDANITGVWDSLTGDGVTIGIVDDGLEVNHPDLSANVNTAIDHDWNDNSPNNPTPGNTSDDHGTSCAGVAAAKGNNGIGVSGAAPDASLVGLRLIAAETTSAEDAEAISWRTDIIDISSNSWGPSDDGLLYPVDTVVKTAFANSVANGRGGLGSIFVWAGGNGRDTGDYSNYDGYNNQIETISVGAINAAGKQSSYSESGANLVVVAPSDNNDNTLPGITTTTLTANGTYTNDFGGTSSATPLVSGVIALVLEQNPNLGWRDVQEILIRSAAQVDASDSDWIDNGAGFHFNHKYGAGRIDAAAATSLANGWTNLGAQTDNSVSSTGLNLSIPDNNSTGVSHTLTLSGTDLRVEQVQLTVDIDHTYRGDIAISITSPDGTLSQVAIVTGDGVANISNFTFCSVRHWGESSNGDWVVNISDGAPDDTGTVKSLSLKAFGTEATTGGYAAWAAANIPNGQNTSETADNDGDGRSNLLEYALRSNPASSDATTNCPTFAGSSFSYVADTSKTDLTYRVERSTTLVNGSWTTVSSSVSNTSGDLETRQVTTTSGARAFYRLVVTK